MTGELVYPYLAKNLYGNGYLDVISNKYFIESVRNYS